MANRSGSRAGWRTRLRGAGLLAAGVLASTCSPGLNYTSGNGSPSGPSSSPLPPVWLVSVAATDREGDALKSAAAPAPPDLVGVTAQTDGLVLTFTVRFAAG